METKSKPDSSATQTGSVVDRLSRFQAISNPYLRTSLAILPALLLFLLLADWLVGSGAFARDLFRLSGVLAIAVEFLILSLVFRQLSEVLEALWQRGLVLYPQDPSQSQEQYIRFIDKIELHLNSRWSWILGVACAIGGLAATYPARVFFQTGASPFDMRGLLAYYLWGNAAIVAAPLGYLLGILFWRVCVIAVMIGRLGGTFRVLAQPNHPDRAGGLKSLGNLCLMIALLLLIPAIYLSVWGFTATFFKTEADIYSQLWAGLFRQGLVLLSLLALFAFLQPLYNVHQQMLKRRREILAELNDLTQRIEELSMELRTKAHTFAPKAGEEKLEALAFMKKVYQENSEIPSWPLDWQTIIKFASAQAVPVLGLIGTSQPIVDLVTSILSSAAR
jgi:hypothetical protein